VNQEHLETDILIIGGGVAGLNAALTARQAGHDVLIMDKGVIERSGHAAGGIDHFAAYLETGPDWDTRDAYLAFTGRSARGATDLSVVEKVYCDELQTAIQRYEKIGCSLRSPDGSYFRTQSFGQPGPWWINFNGKRMKPLLGQAARKAGCRVLDRVTAADLLVHDGEVCGAAGFHIRAGTFFVVKAKAVLLATGGTNRIYQNPTGLSFNCWMCPANTGDGEAMAFRAGARLANVEYLRMTVVPRGFSAPGLNALVGMGGKLVNGMGEEFMDLYDPMGIKGARHKLTHAILTELKAHRGPIRVDCRHLAPDALRHLVTTLSYDKDTLPDYFQQKGIDLSRDLLEVATSEGMQGGPNEVCGSGIKIDRDCATNVPGLFAAGNSADQCRSLHMAVTSGIHAGRSLSAYAARIDESGPPIPQPQVKEIKDRVFAPMQESRTFAWQEFEDVLQRAMTEGMGPARSEWGMKKAWQNLDLLDQWKDQVGAKTYHDLCRSQEVYNIVTVARCMITAALHRKESRFGQCHYRLDFPETDDGNWLGQVVVVKDEKGRAQPHFWPIRYE
jgi:adenylylsulfate reductase subunit A